MRGLATLTALLLLLAPMVAAQEGSDDPSSTSSSSSSTSASPEPEGNVTEEQEDQADDEAVACPTDRRPNGPAEQRACYCRDNPGAAPCDREDEDDDAEAGEWRRWCRDEAREDAPRERCRQAVDDFRGDREARHVTFQVDAANGTLLDYAIDGHVVLAAIHLETGSDNLTVQRKGSVLRIGDHDTELVLHDDPTGLVRFKGDDGSLTVVLAGDAEAAVAADGSAARVTYSDGRLGHVRAENATWLAADTVLAADFFAFLLPPAREDRPAESPQEAAEVSQAIERRKVGAEISVRAPPSPARLASDGSEEGPVQILAYDDVEVEVSMPSDIATPDAPIRIKVSADLDEGRTIVLNLDEAVLESVDPDGLVLRYFDLHEQADGSVVETEVVLRMASSLQDILDPTDDGGQPEFWVVEDANGLQAMFTVPHWSAHAITIGSIAKVLSQPNVLYGIVVGVVGSAVAAVAMMWPRRRFDE